MRQRAALTPKSQVWCRSALPWVMDLAPVTQHAKQSMYFEFMKQTEDIRGKLEEAAGQLDMYIQQEIDRRRGK